MGPPGKIGPRAEKHYIEGSLQRVLKSWPDAKLPQRTKSSSTLHFQILNAAMTGGTKKGLEMANQKGVSRVYT